MDREEGDTINEHATKKLKEEGVQDAINGLLVLQPEHMMTQVEKHPKTHRQTTLSQVRVLQEEGAPDDEISGIADVWNAATAWLSESPLVLIIASFMSVAGCCVCAQVLLASSKESTITLNRYYIKKNFEKQKMMTNSIQQA